MIELKKRNKTKSSISQHSINIKNIMENKLSNNPKNSYKKLRRDFSTTTSNNNLQSEKGYDYLSTKNPSLIKIKKQDNEMQLKDIKGVETNIDNIIDKYADTSRNKIHLDTNNNLNRRLNDKELNIKIETNRKSSLNYIPTLSKISHVQEEYCMDHITEKECSSFNISVDNSNFIANINPKNDENKDVVLNISIVDIELDTNVDKQITQSRLFNINQIEAEISKNINDIDSDKKEILPQKPRKFRFKQIFAVVSVFIILFLIIGVITYLIVNK